MVLIERPAIANAEEPAQPSELGPSSSRRRTKSSSNTSYSGSYLAESALLANSFEQVDALLAGVADTSDLESGAPGIVPSIEIFGGPPDSSDDEQPPLLERLLGARRTTWILGLAALVGVLGAFVLTQFLVPKWTIGAAINDARPRIPSAAIPLVPSASTEDPVVDEMPSPSAETTASLPRVEQVLKPVIEGPPDPTTDAPDELPDAIEREKESSASPESDVLSEQLNPGRVDASLFDEPVRAPKLKIVVSGKAPNWDTRNRVGQAIESLRVPETTLGDFSRLMERIADLPVTIEPEALAMARIDLSHSMSIDVREHTVGEALAKGLRPLNLGYQLSGSHIMLLHRATIENRPESLSLDVSDLVGPNTPASALAALVIQCGLVDVDNESGVSPIQSVSEAIIVHAPPPTQFRVLRFLEQLRLANGLPTRTVYGRQIQATRSNGQNDIAVLRQALIPQWPRRATLSQIVDSVHSQTQVRFLVDWPALEAAGIYYTSQFEITGPSGSLHELLVSFEQVGLRYYAVDDHSIRLTSEEGDRRSGAVALYPMGPIAASTGANPRQLATSLESAFGASVARSGLEWSTMDPRFVYDPGSEHLIVRLPASLHGRFERGLARLREANKVAKSTFPNGRWRS